VVTSAPARLSHLFVHVTDLAASRAFYVELLGLRVLMEEPGYLRVGGGGGFHIGMEEDPDVGSRGIEVVVEVPDVDAMYRRLLERGITFEAPPADMPWGASHVWLRDPSGYRLSLYSAVS
jgi:catechol 2,3-dioxygenase-like lactoylglutathione lyase family enzyme